MASATIETFCCMESNITPKVLTRLQFNSMPYNVVCIMSSLMGMAGAIYQVLPSPSSTIPRRHRSVVNAQKAVINWLALADFFAAVGILLRSIFWMWKGDIVRQHNVENDRDMIYCALLCLWIRYFYTATYLWTLCYATDVYLVSRQKIGNEMVYHIFTWSTSFVLTTTGLGTLYLPRFECHTGPWRVLPNYLLSYVPIVVIMIINPIMYYLSSKNVRILLTGGLGQLTCVEHHLLSALKEKFFCIVLVFYVCWFPNVLNGIILWGFWSNIPQGFLISVWYTMAVVNPLQAVMNSLVYKGWASCGNFCDDLRAIICRCQDSTHSGYLQEISSSEYRMSAADEKPTFSTNAVLVE